MDRAELDRIVDQELALQVRPVGHDDPLTYYVSKLDGGRVRLSRYADRQYGPAMPRESVRHFVNDLEGRVDLPPSGRPDVDAVVAGRAEWLGKGDDGLAFRVGDEVVKVSTTVPYQPENPGHLSPEQAKARLREQTRIHNLLADAGVECLQRAEFVEHGDKGFQIKPYVRVPEQFTRAELDRIQRCITKVHEFGCALHDSVQAGLDERGQPVLFDVGKAGPMPPDDASKGIWSEAKADRDSLQRFYADNGEVYVRLDADEAAQRWQYVAGRVGHWKSDPKLCGFARQQIKKAAAGRRVRARATLAGEDLDVELFNITDDEEYLLGQFGEGV